MHNSNHENQPNTLNRFNELNSVENYLRLGLKAGFKELRLEPRALEVYQ